ncbi:MAG: radical SAM protein [Theionarchaea archaeon]|nr:radical SAM protein [Theionarchaea archaeon]
MFTHLYLEITSACNLSCRHCCIGDNPFNELQKIDVLLKTFSEENGLYVTLSGGEPLLRKDWAEIANLSNELGFTTTIFTNGIRVEKEISSLTKLDVKVAISIDGLDKSIHEYLRGKSYEKVMNAINLLVDAGREKEIALSVTPTPVNLHQLELLAAFAVSKGIEHLHVSLLEVRGRAKPREDLLLTDDEKAYLMKTLYTIARTHEGVLSLELSEGTDLLYDTLNFGKNIMENPLGKTLKFTAEGKVYTSTFVEGDFFFLGEYPHQSLSQILRSPKIEEIATHIRKRPDVIPECNQCIFAPVCCAGVYTLAYDASGSIWVPDYYCKANQAIFEEVILSKVKQ